jgi:hypothetical protein
MAFILCSGRWKPWPSSRKDYFRRPTAVREDPILLERPYVSQGVPHERLKLNILTEGLRYCGRGVGYDDIILKGDPMEMKVKLCGTAHCSSD